MIVWNISIIFQRKIIVIPTCQSDMWNISILVQSKIIVIPTWGKWLWFLLGLKFLLCPMRQHLISGKDHIHKKRHQIFCEVVAETDIEILTSKLIIIIPSWAGKKWVHGRKRYHRLRSQLLQPAQPHCGVPAAPRPALHRELQRHCLHHVWLGVVRSSGGRYWWEISF